MPGTLYGPFFGGLGSGGQDIWLIIQGLQDQLDAIASVKAATIAAMPPAATDLASTMTLLNYLRSRALI